MTNNLSAILLRSKYLKCQMRRWKYHYRLERSFQWHRIQQLKLIVNRYLNPHAKSLSDLSLELTKTCSNVSRNSFVFRRGKIVMKSSPSQCEAMRWLRERQSAVIAQSNLIFNYGILICLKTLLFSAHIFSCISLRNFKLKFPIPKYVFVAATSVEEKVNLIGVKAGVRGQPKNGKY